MRRAFVAQHHAARLLRLAFGLAVHQQVDLLAQAGDFGTKVGTYVNGDRDTGVYPEVLETRINGTILQIRSPTDNVTIRGRTLLVRMQKT